MIFFTVVGVIVVSFAGGYLLSQVAIFTYHVSGYVYIDHPFTYEKPCDT